MRGMELHVILAFEIVDFAIHVAVRSLFQNFGTFR